MTTRRDTEDGEERGQGDSRSCKVHNQQVLVTKAAAVISGAAALEHRGLYELIHELRDCKVNRMRAPPPSRSTTAAIVVALMCSVTVAIAVRCGGCGLRARRSLCCTC